MIESTLEKPLPDRHPGWIRRMAACNRRRVMLLPQFGNT